MAKSGGKEMKICWRKGTAALLALLLLAALPGGVQAGVKEKIKLDKGDLKKAALLGVGAAALPKAKDPAGEVQVPGALKIEIPGIDEETAPKGKAEKKAAKKARREKEKAVLEAEKEAFASLEEMAGAGDAQAEYIVGCAAYAGLRCRADEARALYWWKKAAVQGHREADAFVGLSFAEGLGGCLKSPKEALRRYRRAEANGSSTAAALLGIDLYKSGAPEEKAAAVACFEEAAARGCAPAKRILADILREGTGKRRDFSRAVRWKDEMEKTGLAGLCREAGMNAFWGRAVGQSYEDAVRWWEISAGFGDVKARGLLGTAYYTGRGAPKDGAKALEHLKAAAAASDPLAEYTLGRVYLEGVIVKKNKGLALKLLKAAGQGGIESAKRLALQAK